MNERIRKLAIKSGIDIRGHLTGNLTLDEKPSVIDLEKFAELIVQECIETLRLVPYNSDREFGDEVIYQDTIKKHFGVEQ